MHVLELKVVDLRLDEDAAADKAVLGIDKTAETCRHATFQLYRELVAATGASQAEPQKIGMGLAESVETAVARWRAEVEHYLPLIARVLSQTQCWVFDGQRVPAGEKLVSLFEPHADIIVKGGPPSSVRA
jgi:hypothetical protein